MCKLLIYNADAPNHPTDQEVNAMLFQRGHVITIIEDGEEFGTADVGPHTTVVLLPGRKKEEFDHLMTAVVLDIADKQTGQKLGERVVQLRMWRAKNLAQLRAVPVRNVMKGMEVAFTEQEFALDESKGDNRG